MRGTRSIVALLLLLLARHVSAIIVSSGSDKERKCAALNGNATQCVSSDCVWHIGQCLPNKGLFHCNDGLNEEKCLNVAECAKGVADPSEDNKWAFVFTHSLEKEFTGLSRDTMVPVQQFAKKYGHTDILLLIPKQGSSDRVHFSVDDWNRTKLFTDFDVKVRDVDWSLPPGMKYNKRGPWCGAKDLMRLHMFGMTEYASVVYMDTDTSLNNIDGMANLFKCASKNYILSATGPMSAFNVGVMAVKPSLPVLQASVEFGRLADYSKVTGWGDAGWAPFQHKYIGAECGQGYMHTLFLKRASPAVAEAVRLAGAEAAMPAARQMDRCLWNWQHANGDCPDTKCEDIVVIHKDKQGDWCRRKTGY